MMERTVGAIPVVSATRFVCQNFITGRTKTISAVAIRIYGGFLFAGCAVPEMCAMRIRRICLPAGWTEPVIVVAIRVHSVMRFAARTCPIVVTTAIL